MQASQDRHSRFVSRTKVVLPLIALGLLSTVFLISERPDPDAAFKIAPGNLQEILRDQRITAPSFAGVTPDGASITVRADTAHIDQTKSGDILAMNVDGEIVAASGETIALVAESGVITQDTQIITFQGSVELRLNNSYDLRAPRLVVIQNEDMISADQGVQGTAPLGELQAGNMNVTQNENGLQLIFGQGVRILYEPSANSGQTQ